MALTLSSKARSIGSAELVGGTAMKIHEFIVQI
jgi:hypothetical protein